MHVVAAVLGAGVLLAALGAFVVATDAGMEHDDAVYLTRGLYHAAQVSERGNLLLPRLVWSLGFEAPKPPLFHGLLALATMTFGRQNVGAVLVAGTLVPLLALSAAIFALAREAAGRRAGLLALAAYFAMPAALGLGTRLLTETTLAATVVAGSFFAFRRARGGGLGDEIGVGVCAGLSLLAKLLGPLFLGPAALVAWMACWRAEGPGRAVRFAAVAGAVALLVAGPWYWRNGHAALAFVRYARQHGPSLYAAPAWLRPLDFVSGTVGWVLALVLLALLLRRPAAGNGTGLLRRMAFCAAAISALAIALQPMFDPRFWLPAAALVAAWAGVELDAVWQRTTVRLRPLLAAAMVLLLAGAIYSLATTRRARTPWRAARAMAVLRTPATPSPLLCTLGNSAEWNVEKLRLAVELSDVRPRLAVNDLLTDGRAIDLPARLERCDVVFALPPEEVDALPNERALNADLVHGWEELDRHAPELAPDPAAARALGSPLGVEVFRRHREPTGMGNIT